MAKVTNPLPLGHYVLDLWSPTSSMNVRDGVPIFNRWRESNAERVRVIKAECWNTEPRQTRVEFEVLAAPGAFPFGQLGQPELAAHVAGAGVPSILDAVEFLFDPLGSLESSAAEAGAKMFAELSSPELAQVRAALSAVRVNIATIRALLEAIKNGTSPDPHGAILAAKQLITASISALTAALGSVLIDFPRHVVTRVIDDLRALAKEIEDAPAKALRALGRAALDVAVPFEAAGMGGAIVALAVAWMLYNGKRSDTTDTLILGGAVLLFAGGTSLFDNLLHPADHAAQAARDLKGN